MEAIITLLIWVLMALWCKNIAEKNHRDTTIAVLGYYVAGEKTESAGPKA